MIQELVRTTRPGLPAQIADWLPPMIAADERAAWRFVDFFAVTIRNHSCWRAPELLNLEECAAEAFRSYLHHTDDEVVTVLVDVLQRY